VFSLHRTRSADEEILFSPDRPLFTFIEAYAAGRPGLKESDPYDFFRNYRFGPAVLSDFRSHLKKGGISLTSAEFEKSKEDVLFFLKRTLAAKLWGDEAGLKVQVFRDRQIREALEHLPEAQALLARAYPSRKSK
jgi:hypothetical protein